MNFREGWQLFAVGSAFFAGLTARFGKIGVAAIRSNLATFIRTIVILIVTVEIISIREEWQKPSVISFDTWFFLILSDIATGLVLALLLPRAPGRPGAPELQRCYRFFIAPIPTPILTFVNGRPVEFLAYR